jgi:hypothetical protein
MKNSSYNKRNGERGIALVTALLAMVLIMGLGMAVVLSTSTDTTTARIQRSGEQAFFVADAGIGVARKALAQALQEALNTRMTALAADMSSSLWVQAPTADSNPDNFPHVQAIPSPDGTWNNSFYTGVRDSAIALAMATERVNRFAAINDSGFTVTFHPFTGTVTPAAVAPYNAGTEVIVLRYWIEVTGKTAAGGSATVNETGRVSANINMLYSPPSGTSRNFSFSGFGAFFDNGDTNNNSYLASGTFSGPVHTNSHFAINSDKSVTFRNIVSQVDSQIRWGNSSYFSGSGSTAPNHAIPTVSSPVQGITISNEGYAVTSPVPLPANAFSQEYSVINATGITDLRSDGTPKDPPAVTVDSSGNPITVLDSSGHVTRDALVANLRAANGNRPSTSGSEIANGVYISSDGSSITGAGIYVQGGADDVQLIADANGDQIFKIRQSSVTTTITEHFDAANPANQTTTISSTLGTRTYNGVFTDKSDPSHLKNGAMLYVANSSGTGSIASLRGGKDSSNSNAAIATSTALTVCAERNITVTGDLKYANAVAASDGTPVANVNSISNVLGIFTNNGNVILAPNSTYLSGSGLSMEIDAAIASFNSNTSDDSSAVNRIDGSIVYSNSTNPGSNDRWRLVGSRVQAKINSIGYSSRDIYYDTRFSGGQFRPPFFPGTTYALGPPPSAGSISFAPPDTPAATAISWFRNNN